MIGSLSRQYAKLCDVADFADPAFRQIGREIMPERDFDAHVERKVWEFVMLALFLDEIGQLQRRARLLSVGAGTERIVFWLANRVGGVVATDIYGHGPFSEGSADSRMLSEPEIFSPYPFDHGRLEVRHMDARALEFPDGSFDVAFSLSSIEHFGSHREMAAAMREMARVTRPGGAVLIATDCFVRLHPLDRAAAAFAIRLATGGRRNWDATPWRRAGLGEVLTPAEIKRWIVAPSGMELAQPLDRRISAESWENLATLRFEGEHGEMAIESRTGSVYPLVLLRSRRSTFTSVFLPLVGRP